VNRHVYLSPHLDDAVFSCGGLIARQVAEGAAVTVLTICAGDPPPGEVSPFASQLHARWGEATAPVAARRAEDRIACGRLGASVVHLGVPDAIYRKDRQDAPTYTDEASIFGRLSASDENTVNTVTGLILPYRSSDVALYAPLGCGGHVDHRLTRLAAERLDGPIWYYSDLPYAARGASVPDDLGQPAGKPVSRVLAGEEIEGWATAAFEYASQRSTFWSSYEELLRELRDFHESNQGFPLVGPA
jgi:LmbE family N-acetylglucosaminyl deacetylase